MKKLATIALSALLVLGFAFTGATFTATATTTEQNAATQAETANVYLVPGSYENSNRETVYNTIASGATKLTDGESAAIHTPNAYKCTLSAGDELPVPVTTKADVTFNGWWTIENAEIVYHKTLPEADGTVYLYADWRADLSQSKDPIIPDADAEQNYPHYMEITRAATGRKEKIQLFVSGTDVPNAEKAGYGGPVQFYNEWFLLQPGDEMRIYISNLYGKEATLAPQFRSSQRKVTFEANLSNSTGNWLKQLSDSDAPNFTGDYSNSIHGEPRSSYTGSKATVEHHFRIYIKFYDGGGTMTVYMENQDK